MNRDTFLEDIKDEYEDIREDHYDNLKERKYLSIEKAREKKLNINWNDYRPSKPVLFMCDY